MFSTALFFCSLFIFMYLMILYCLIFCVRLDLLLFLDRRDINMYVMYVFPF